MFDTLLIITLFLLASLLVCLLTLRLSINIKHLCLFFSFIADIKGYFAIPTPPPRLVYFDPPVIKFNKDLQPPPPPPPPFILTPPPSFIRHLRVCLPHSLNIQYHLANTTRQQKQQISDLFVLTFRKQVLESL